MKRLTLDDETRAKLEALTRCRTVQAQEIQRAKILILRADGKSENFIADKLDITRKTVSTTVRKYRDHGLEYALRDEPRSGRQPSYTDEIRAIIINFACQSPKELGLPQELWTFSALTTYINAEATDACGERVKVSRSAVWRALNDADIKPHKIKYYCEKRDPDFERKMNELLVVYKQARLQFDDNGNVLCADEDMTVTLSYDEKPGIQAIATTAPDLGPLPTGGCVMRDYDYKRLGKVSLLAAIDLLSGKAIPLVRDTHTSQDFIDFLKKLDASYPPEQTLRLILDNLSVHTSKATREYLASVRDGRFVFVFTPKHGSWLNLIESFFSKMTRQMLRGIRVSSKDELTKRIYKYFNEINESPVVFRWKYKLDDVVIA